MVEPLLPASLSDSDVYARKAAASARAEADKAAAKLAKHQPKPEDDSSFIDYAKTAAESAAAGVLSIPGGVAGVVGSGLEAVGAISPETAQAVRDNSSGRALLANLAGMARDETLSRAGDILNPANLIGKRIGQAIGLGGGEETPEQAAEQMQAGLQAREEYSEAARARKEANPLTALLGEGLGQIGGLAVTGGLGGGPSAAGGAVRSALGGGLAARLAGGAVTTGLEGAAIGLGAEQNEAWVKEQHMTGQQVFASVGLNGLLGAGLGLAGGLLVEGAGAARGAIGRIAGKVAETGEEAAPGLTEKAVASKGTLRSLIDGDDAAVQRVFTATTGEEAAPKMPEFYRAVVKGERPAEEVADRASRELYEHSTRVEENLRAVTEEVSNKSLKLENVAKNFETAPPPAGAVEKAKQAAYSLHNAILDTEEKIVDSVSSTLRAGGFEEAVATRIGREKASALTKLRVALGKGADEVEAAKTPAEAYVASDQMRREVLATLDHVGKSAQVTTDPLARGALHQAAEEMRATYQRAAEHLFDESVWGRQGAVQRKVNEAWVDFINARKNVFRGFADQTGETLLPNGLKIPEFDMKEAALSKLVGDMSGPGARDASRRWTQYLDATDRLTGAIGEGYSLSGTKSGALDALKTGIAGVRKTVTGAAESMGAIRQAEELVHAGHSTHLEQSVGMAGGAALGGLLGGPVGAAAGGYLGKAAGALTSPANLLEHRVQLQMVAERVRRNMSSAIGTYFANIDRQAVGEAVKRTAGRVGQAAAATGGFARAAALPSAMTALQGRAKSPEEGYRKRAEQLISLTANDGQGIQDAVVKALGPAAAHDPHMALGFTTAALTAAQYLKDKLPTPLLNPNSLTPMASRPQPSRLDLHEFAEVAQALDHPTEVLTQGLATGSISQPAIQAIKAVFPDYYDWVREQAAEKIAERDADGKPLPLRHVAILDTLLDLNGAGSPLLTDDFALQRGSAISAGRQSEQGQPPRRTSAKNPMGDRMAPPTAEFQRTQS